MYVCWVQAQHWRWLEEVDKYSATTKCSVGAHINRQPGCRSLKLVLYVTWPKDRPGANLVNTVWKRRTEGMDFDTCEVVVEEEMVAVDLALLLGQLDQHHGTPFAEQMHRWGGAGMRLAVAPWGGPRKTMQPGLDEWLAPPLLLHPRPTTTLSLVGILLSVQAESSSGGD